MVDDKLVNLDSWSSAGGISIFFNKEGSSIDIHGDINTKYPMVSDLSFLVNGFEDIIKERF